MERKHIALFGAVAALASPTVAAAAAQHERKLPPRVRLRANAPNVKAAGLDAPSDTDDATGVSAIGDAVAVGGPLFDPVDRYSELIAETAERTVHRREVHARKKREAKEEEELARLPGGVSMTTLEAIAACESGGDPEAVSSDGTYRGKYQFDQGTWESVGGHGDPAQAPEAEQDYRAALLYSESGSSPWPICG